MGKEVEAKIQLGNLVLGKLVDLEDEEPENQGSKEDSVRKVEEGMALILRKDEVEKSIRQNIENCKSKLNKHDDNSLGYHYKIAKELAYSYKLLKELLM